MNACEVSSRNSAANTLVGAERNDNLNCGAGADTLMGGLGNDTYIVDSAGDVVVELAGKGADEVEASFTYTLGEHLENLTLTGTAAINGTGNSLNNVLTGNAASNVLLGGASDDVLDGGAGADTLLGKAGDDIYGVDNAGDAVVELANEGNDWVQSSISHQLAANVEHLILMGTAAINGTGNALDIVLNGNSGAHTLSGAAGNDTLNGGAGADNMAGGEGDDAYVVDNAGDVITELANEGADTVCINRTYTLGANLENLVLTGTANLHGTGNEQDNLLTGDAGPNAFTGGAGNDDLSGLGGTDRLNGGLGNGTYRFCVAYGTDTVNDDDGDAGSAELAIFGADVAADQLWFRRESNNLEISIIGTTDKLLVMSWYLGDRYQLEQFHTADNQTLLSNQVDNLVQAMAAFAPPPSGQITLIPEQQSALSPVIAANCN